MMIQKWKLKKSKSNSLAFIILIILYSCSSKESELDIPTMENFNIHENSNVFECSSNLFNRVEIYNGNISNETGFQFFRIANSDTVINETCYKLYYLKSKSGELSGYWGDRNDSILFIPYKTEAIFSIEYLIYNKGFDGYFTIDNDLGYNEKLFNSIIGKGYSYKRIISGENFASLIHYVDAKYIENITENEYILESVPLIINLHYDFGIRFFSYDYYIDKQLVIPWVEQLLYREYAP